MTGAPSGYLSVNQAAQTLGIKPWDVIRLVEANLIDSVVLVEEASLRAYAQENQ